MSALTVEIAHKEFARHGAGGISVLKDLKLSAQAGQFVCILGPSGSGKTTLLRIVSGLDRDFTGTISLPGSDGSRDPKLAYVFQEPVLLPWRTVRQNLHLVMSDDQIARGLAEQFIEAVGLNDVLDAYPSSLSLGMSRRVSLARAFAVEPDVLLMDEPFVSLDEATAEGLRDLLTDLLARKPATVLFVTHDSREAVRLGQRIVMMSPGKPTSIVKDIPIELSEQERHDPKQIERIRMTLNGA